MRCRANLCARAVQVAVVGAAAVADLQAVQLVAAVLVQVARKQAAGQMKRLRQKKSPV